MRAIALLPALVIACAPPADGDGDPAGVDDTGEAAAARVGPGYSRENCPTIDADDDDIDDFETGDTEYDVELLMPDEPEGAAVLFAWHWLGGTGSQAIRYMELEELMEGEDVIVVAPRSSDSDFEWAFLQGPEDNPDLLLFDDLLSCLWQQYDVDLDRIWATGMSAGGLWTSYLTIHRAEWLAATAPLSGGAIEGAYAPPAEAIPVLMTWGGPGDTYGALSFADTSEFMSQALQDDGHFVAHCIHDDGHNLPPGGIGYAWQFLKDHPRGVDPEPYANGLPGSFPEWCALP